MPTKVINPQTPPRAGGAPPGIDWSTLGRGGDLNSQVNDIIRQGGSYVDWMANTEEQRGQRAEDTLAAGAAAFDRPSMTDQDIRRQMAGAGERANRDFLKNAAGLRDWMGGAGILGGGMAQSMMTDFAAQHAGTMTDATMSLYEKRVASDVLDRAQRWNAQQALAEQQGRAPSTAVMDWLNSAGGMRLGAGGIDAMNRQGDAAADASRDAGKMSGAGSVLQGIIGTAL